MSIDRITRDPAVMGGKPCIRGLRVTVGTIVGLMEAGTSVRELLALYPHLEEEDIRQALAYADLHDDASDLATFEARRNEPRRDFEDVARELKRRGKL